MIRVRIFIAPESLLLAMTHVLDLHQSQLLFFFSHPMLLKGAVSMLLGRKRYFLRSFISKHFLYFSYIYGPFIFRGTQLMKSIQR